MKQLNEGVAGVAAVLLAAGWGGDAWGDSKQRDRAEALRASLGSCVGDSHYDPRFDLDGSGCIDSLDVWRFRQGRSPIGGGAGEGVAGGSEMIVIEDPSIATPAGTTVAVRLRLLGNETPLFGYSAAVRAIPLGDAVGEVTANVEATNFFPPQNLILAAPDSPQLDPLFSVIRSWSGGGVFISANTADGSTVLAELGVNDVLGEIVLEVSDDAEGVFEVVLGPPTALSDDGGFPVPFGVALATITVGDPEPLPTRFVGTVAFSDGEPAVGAAVFTDLGGSATSGKDGSFELEFEPPEGTGSLRLTATATSEGVAFEGSMLVAPIAFGEVNDAGTIVIVPTGGCSGQFGWTSEFAGSGMNGPILASAVVDDGSGPVLFVAGEFTEADGTSASRIARWDGDSWSPLGEGLNGFVSALVEFDDGSGPALYAGGGFSLAGGVSATGIARWDGESWSAVGGGVQGSVRSLVVFNDGSGPVLVAGGYFTEAGGVAAASIAKWDGTAWSPLGGGMLGFVQSLTVFDDGSGAALIAGGIFVQAGGTLGTAYVARWDGESWSSLGGGMNNPVYSLLSFDDGTGPALYAGGAFTLAGDAPANRIARWDGVAWSPLASGMNSTVRSIVAFDDGSGNGPAVHAAGFFTTAGGGGANRIARWMDGSWEPLGMGLNGTVMTLSVLETAPERGLIAGGYFTGAAREAASRLAAWTCLDR